ncbi:hypothetical protein B6S09_03190 [Oceanimonas baumannii]|uniref:Uncharacterized protein n=2 Tax=Oceanimonas baumannii TaxID=129578 RepID=A0A235CMQ5_9GAMM|nr:hypothetical protein B6S09_03190 [Oceanimonas baumannii]TDW60126.1 hypothetical protein LY04_01121 [Oceanimonas baumannii]
MVSSFMYHGVRLLTLLTVLLLPSLSQAEQGHYREHHRLQQYAPPDRQHRSQNSYRHDRQHKAARNHGLRRHKHHVSPRVRVQRPYYYSPPRVLYRGRASPGPGIAVLLPLGSLIRELPGGYISLYFNGYPYYYHGGNYYRSYRHGYRVVAPPGRSSGW